MPSVNGVLFRTANEFCAVYSVGSELMDTHTNKIILTIENIDVGSITYIDHISGKTMCHYFPVYVPHHFILKPKAYVTQAELDSRCQHDYRVYQGFMRKQEEHEEICFKCGESKLKQYQEV